MNIMAKLYKTDGSVIDVSPENGTDFQLPELMDMVEGYIEIPYYTENEVMVINEMGKVIGLDINKKATELYRKAHPKNNDFIVGNALICSKNQIK